MVPCKPRGSQIYPNQIAYIHTCFHLRSRFAIFCLLGSAEFFVRVERSPMTSLQSCCFGAGERGCSQKCILYTTSQGTVRAVFYLLVGSDAFPERNTENPWDAIGTAVFFSTGPEAVFQPRNKRNIYQTTLECTTITSPRAGQGHRQPTPIRMRAVRGYGCQD